MTAVHARACSTASFLGSVSRKRTLAMAMATDTLFPVCAMARIVDFSAPLGQKAGKGHWNDLDMLEIGNGGMTYDEYGAYILHYAAYTTYNSRISHTLLHVGSCQESSHSR